jgi:hypothetical protein
MPIDNSPAAKPQAKNSLTEVISKTATAEVVDSFLTDCAYNGRWDDLKISLRYPHVRAGLASRIWIMQDQAMGDGRTDDLCKALPSRLDAATAKTALDYPFRSKTWDLTLRMLNLGASISDDQFTQACDQFSDGADAYYRKVIEWAVHHEMVSWQHTLGFANLDDWQQLLERADRDANPSLYLVASGLMTAKQKRQAIQASTTEERLLLIVKNMTLPKRWQEQVPEAFRAAVLAYDLGV